MRHACVTAALVVAGALPVQADDLPARKAGLWELRFGEENDASDAPAIQQCVDAATDRMLQSVMGPWTGLLCTRRDVRQAGDTVTADATCRVIPDKPERDRTVHTVTVHAVFTGSFATAYTMTMTVQGDVPGGTMARQAAARWLGPCAAGQKPGDVIMGGVLGTIRLNVREMQRR
jgi:hypothetical protein